MRSWRSIALSLVRGQIKTRKKIAFSVAGAAKASLSCPDAKQKVKSAQTTTIVINRHKDQSELTQDHFTCSFSARATRTREINMFATVSKPPHCPKPWDNVYISTSRTFFHPLKHAAIPSQRSSFNLPHFSTHLRTSILETHSTHISDYRTR